MSLRTLGWVSILIAGCMAATPAPCAWERPEVAGWAATLESPGLTVESRARTIESLRRAARDLMDDSLGRDAGVALALYLRESEQDHPGERLELMSAAVTRHADHPKIAGVMARLAPMHIEAGEILGAHLTFKRLFQRPEAPSDPKLWLQASINAARVGDLSSAASWSDDLDAAAFDEPKRSALDLLRIKILEPAGRHAEVLEAAGRVEQVSPDALRQDARALLAVARTDAAVGRLESAAERYDAFINIHSGFPQRPVAMLEYARLLARLSRMESSKRMFSWILVQYPGSYEADLAEIERIDLDKTLALDQRVAAYQEIALSSRRHVRAFEATRRMLETLIAAGRPLQAISTLGWMARETDGLGSLAARKSLKIGLEAALTLLASRDDDVALAAAAAAVAGLGIALPRELEQKVRGARRRLGLSTDPEIETARELARAGRWQELSGLLEPPYRLRRRAVATADPEQARLMADALWREGREADALVRLEKALSASPQPPGSRELLVLRADILFAAGRAADACVDYRAASAISASPWVERQVVRCERQGANGAETPS